MIERVRSWIQDAEMCLLSRVAGLSLRHWLYFPLSLRGSELCKFCHQSVSKRVRADLPIFVTTWTRLQRIYNWPTAHVAQAACLKQTKKKHNRNDRLTITLLATHIQIILQGEYHGHIERAWNGCFFMLMGAKWDVIWLGWLPLEGFPGKPGWEETLGYFQKSLRRLCVSSLPYLLFYDFWSVTSLIYQFI